MRGTIIKAYVVLRDRTKASENLVKEIQEHTKKVAAPYKYPREIEFVTELPKTQSGKIKRKELRELEWRKKEWVNEHHRLCKTSGRCRGNKAGLINEETDPCWCAEEISDMDKNALEEAIKIKEKHGGKITVLSVGAPDAKEQLKELLAMGADEAVLVPRRTADYHVVSHLLAGAIKKIGSYDIILCGEASIDMFSGQTGPRVAGILGIPQITYARMITVEKDKLVSERDLGDTSITIESPFPVLTHGDQGNQPTTAPKSYAYPRCVQQTNS